ncbi:MAG: hypothetical protein OEV89_05980 [Desulfobulbaceae bacterium]|nr:hypothetical protein [Desulfobulbaceae bacterium]HIJ90301.1 universal stress protein [Deltaproteobacteria bacterium]
MSALTTLFKKLEESMTAATFAEAGEFETARQFLKSNKNAHKRVLLGTDKPEIEPRTISYALHLCQRLGGGLEIFHMLRMAENETNPGLSQEEKPLAALNAALEPKGVVYQPVSGPGCLADEVLRHAGGRRDILCVVFDTLEPEGTTCRKAKENMIARLQALHCPVVMYAGAART